MKVVLRDPRGREVLVDEETFNKLSRAGDVVRDGESLRVTMQMLDSLTNNPAGGRMYRVGPGWTEPGFAAHDGSGPDVRDEAYRQMCERLRSAWKRPFGQPQQQDAPASRVSDALPTQLTDEQIAAARNAAYQRSVEALRNAWKRQPR